MELLVLLAMDTIEPFPPADMKAEFYSSYFIVPKKGGGLQPILDLNVLKQALYKLPFKMVMQMYIFECTCPRDWFAVFELKGVYFHVKIFPQHMRFLHFAFEDRAYQNKVLLFGLSLSSCAEAAFAPINMAFSISMTGSFWHWHGISSANTVIWC